MKPIPPVSMGRSVALVVIASLLAAPGCTSLQVIPLAADSRPQVRAGENVRVTLNDGQVREFEVEAVEPDAVLGPGIRAAYRDLARIEARRFDRRKTWILVTTVGVLVTGALAVAALEAYGNSKLLGSATCCQ